MHRVRNIHLLGVGGCGVSGLAKVLQEMGYRVSGSDIKENTNTIRLKDLDVKVYIGHTAENVRDADLIVYSSALSFENAEMQEAQAKKIPIIKRAQMLAWIMEQSPIRIAVAGTHGKTTTTAMLARVLEANKFSPTYFIGCDMDYVDGNARRGDGKIFVTEADESDSSFLFLKPSMAVITNVEDDHMERFGTVENLLNTFVAFSQNVAEDGCIAIDGTHPNNQVLMKRLSRRLITYGLNYSELDFSADNLSFSEFTSHFSLLYKGKKMGEVDLSVPGWQNVLNSLAVFAIGLEFDIKFNAIVNALRTFVGARRRFQTVGDLNDILIIDDYAHHPTEVRATLSAARLGWPGRRIICVFQPHRYSRTRLLKNQFAAAFKEADKVIITDIYAASEDPIPGVSGKSLAEAITGQVVEYIGRKEKITDNILKEIKPGDIVLTLGAGDIYTVGKELLARLRMKDEISKK